MVLSPFVASLALLIGGGLWGVYWMPVHYLEDLGLIGATAGIAVYVGCLTALLPAFWHYRRVFAVHWRMLLFSGLMTGAGFSLYSTSLAYTDVIRTLLLFYLTPIWGTIIGLLFLKERLTTSRIMAMALAFGGLMVILRDANGLPIPSNIGDVLALLSGMFWAIGSYGLLRAQAVPAIAQMIAFLLGGLFVSCLTLFMLGRVDIALITAIDYSILLPALVLITLYAVPMIWLTIAPARVLSPARVGILLMSEVVVGAITAALLSGEVFGMREAIGTALIIAAALSEVSGTRQAQAQDQES